MPPPHAGAGRAVPFRVGDGKLSYTRALGNCYVELMKLFKRSSKPRRDAEGRPPRAKGGAEDGTNAVRHRPDPRAEPIPDGEHKYVPRSPYRTGNW